MQDTLLSAILPHSGVMLVTLDAFALAVLYWLGFCYRAASWAKTTVKTGSVLLLVLAAWLAMGPTLLIVALLLCALGDYLLSRDSEAQFMAGVGAFAAGHLAYVGLFLTHPMARPQVLNTAPHLAVIAGLAGFGLIMAVVLWRKAGEMRVPVMIYVPIILSMGVAVLALPSLGPLALALPAAFLFIASDFTLAMEMFVLRDDHPLRRFLPFLVWPTYWLAQLGFACAFALIAIK